MFLRAETEPGSIISRGRIFILEDVFVRCSQYFSAIFFRQKPFRLEEDYKLWSKDSWLEYEGISVHVVDRRDVSSTKYNSRGVKYRLSEFTQR